MPARIFQGYVRQLPRLTASLALRDAQSGRVAQMNKHGFMRAISEWEQVVRGKQVRRNDGGISALVAMRDANERARAEGTLLT